MNLRSAMLLVSLIVTAPAGGAESDASPDVNTLILRAGNEADDRARLEILGQLAEREDLSPSLKADVDRMVAFVERWLGEESLYRWYDREVRRTVDYDFSIAADSPLYPIACLYRGRMLVWTVNEYGNIIGYHDERRRFLDKAVGDFKVAREAFPDNPIVGMYLGTPIPWEKELPHAEDAPAWARLQRENLERLADIVAWWIDNRLGKNGEYGGGWDDDCEMWRHWVPVMIAFDWPKATRAQEFFSTALLSQEYMKDGYTSRSYDVEHTAEPSTDTITPMMHLAPDDPEWRARALRITELMEKLWMGKNERGMLQFKSTYFSAQKVDPDPRRACDTPYHVVALPPALVLWQRTADKRLTRLFSEWMDTWVDAAARAERGKPAGILPAAIRWPTGEPAGPGSDWWDPRHHGEPRLYEWPSAMRLLTDMLLLTYHMTGNEKYLTPLRSMARARLAWRKKRDSGPFEPGSLLWCGSKMGFLAGTLAKYRLLTGSHEFDEVLRSDYRALAVTESDRERPDLTAALERSAEALRVNFPGYTSEVRFTDRVLTFPRLFSDDMLFPDALPASNKRPDPALLYATATGDRGAFRVFPLNAVRWLTPPRDIAALVTRSSRKRFTAELFHFGETPRTLGAELYLLSPGRYSRALLDGHSDSELIPPGELTVRGPRTRIELELPPGRLCVLKVTPL